MSKYIYIYHTPTTTVQSTTFVSPYRVLPQALPYVGAFLDQIYSLEMSSKTYNPNGLVNFAKMTKLSAIVRSALQYQEQHYTFDPRLDVSIFTIGLKCHVTHAFVMCR